MHENLALWKGIYKLWCHGNKRIKRKIVNFFGKRMNYISRVVGAKA
jgi:hypothetical protein